MSFARWLILIFLVSLTALALVVGGLYFLSWRQAEATRMTQGNAYAQALAAQLGARAEGVQDLVESLAADPRWGEDLVQQPWAAIEVRLQRVIPHALWVRVLPADGDAGQGVLGFADLDLAQRALQGTPPLAMHGLGT
ncbi:MAG TPA: hypothetical protein ENK50_02055, partial [Sedimenticola sp.]|nr:hypothetical protein [Sedimenticola sp.]